MSLMCIIMSLSFACFRWDSTFKRDYKMGQEYNCMVKNNEENNRKGGTEEDNIKTHCNETQYSHCK